MTASGPVDRKEQIRRAAAAVIARNGFHQSSVDMIASEAGVAVGTIYNHFSDKVDILKHIFAVEHARRKELFAAIAALELPAIDKLMRGIRGHLTAIAMDDSAARILLQEAALPHADNAMLPMRGGALSDFVLEVARDGEARGELRSDPPALAVVVTGAVIGLVEAHVRGTEGEGRSGEVSADDGHWLPPLFTAGIRQIEQLLRGGIGTKTDPSVTT